MKAIIRLVIAALIVHATWRAGNVWVRYYKFKDGVQQAAQFSERRPISELPAVKRSPSKMRFLDPDSVQAARENTLRRCDLHRTHRAPAQIFYPQVKVS